MAKRGPRRLKIGVQSRFGPNSTVEFEAVFRKKFGVAYCTGSPEIDQNRLEPLNSHLAMEKS